MILVFRDQDMEICPEMKEEKEIMSQVVMIMIMKESLWFYVSVSALTDRLPLHS